MVHGKLEVIVVEAKHLKSGNDPYVKLTVGGKTVKTTVKKHGGKDATFDEKFEFEIFDGVDELTVEVYDMEHLSKDELKGSKTIDLENVFEKKTHDATYSLTHKDKHAGDVQLVLYFHPHRND